MAQRLRQETAASHRALEARVDIEARLRSIDAYAALLGALHPFYQMLEELLARCDGWERLEPPVDLRVRRKAHLLADDLRALGNQPAPGEPVPPRLRGLAGALGALYVVEGATLGGAIVARRAAAELGLRSDHGLAFFTSYGTRRAQQWKAFHCSLADFAEPALPADRDDVVRGARATFAAMDSWLEQAA
jgi:heme oxygenase (biliverdin-IX-beta and delta-forming)